MSRQLAAGYVRSGWLEKAGTGVFKRPDDEATWIGVLHTLQKINGLPVHLGGKTALELYGYGHYINKKPEQNIILWKSPDVRLPSWFKDADWGRWFSVRSAQLFENENQGITEMELEGFNIKLSSPERAAIEYVQDIPKEEGFGQALYIMEGLAGLRPDLLQTLLEGCRSIKAKRLFLYIAEAIKQPWFRHLDISSIDLGSGKREIIKGGKLDRKYRITVPRMHVEV